MSHVRRRGKTIGRKSGGGSLELIISPGISSINPPLPQVPQPPAITAKKICLGPPNHGGL
jgi:hypothetical protein